MYLPAHTRPLPEVSASMSPEAVRTKLAETAYDVDFAARTADLIRRTNHLGSAARDKILEATAMMAAAKALLEEAAG